jgi:hypothetical protein
MKIRKSTIQKTKDSFYVSIPKMWISEMNLKKGDIIAWFIDENDHHTLKLRLNVENIEKYSMEG